MNMRFLNVDEVAELTRLRPSTIYKLAARGEIPSQKMRRHRVFPADLIEEWIRNEGRRLPDPSDDEQ